MVTMTTGPGIMDNRCLGTMATNAITAIAMTTNAMTTNAMTTDAMATNAMTAIAITSSAMTTNAMSTDAVEPCLTWTKSGEMVKRGKGCQQRKPIGCDWKLHPLRPTVAWQQRSRSRD